jgi:hypothetical protein
MRASREGLVARRDQDVLARLAEAGRRIDEIAARVGNAREDTRARVAPRVDSLRGLEAVARTTTRRAAEPGFRDDHSLVDLDDELEEIDTQIEIAIAQLDLDDAAGREAFQAAAERQIAGYRMQTEQLQAHAFRANRTGGGADPALIDSIRRRTAAATERLDRLRAASGETWDAVSAGVLAALDDLDHAAEEAGSQLRHTSSR